MLIFGGPLNDACLHFGAVAICLNVWRLCLQVHGDGAALTKKKKKFFSYCLSGKSNRIGCKVIYEEGLPNL